MHVYSFESLLKSIFFTRKINYLLLILVLCINEADGQDIVFQKNTVHGSAATFLYVGSYTFNYERSVLTTPGLQTFVSAGFGGWYATTILNWTGGYSAPVSFNSLIGRGNNFFEVDLGARFLFHNADHRKATQVIPLIKLGCRYQKRDGRGAIFRAFIGLTGVGVGVGKAF